MLVGAAALTIALAGARAIADIVGPVFLALVSRSACTRYVSGWNGIDFRSVAASIVLLLAAYLVLGLLTLALIVSVAQLAELLPQYTTSSLRWWRMQGTRCRASASSRSRSTPS